MCLPLRNADRREVGPKKWAKEHAMGGNGVRGPKRESRNDRDFRENPVRNEVRRKAAELVKDAGIPPNLAHQVALGNLTLNEVIERLALRDKVEALVRKHELPKSLATQIALGQADLEQVLQKRRLGEHLAGSRERSVLVEAAADKRPMFLALHHQRMVHGAIEAVDRYELRVKLADGGVVETIHKLQVKYACDEAQAKGVRNQLRRDKERPDSCEPVVRPQDRYGCSDRRLFSLIDQKSTIQVTLLEGEVLKGTPTWMGRWEFGMVLPKKKAEVVIFRHALFDLREA
jgi:hypothetical protein